MYAPSRFNFLDDSLLEDYRKTSIMNTDIIEKENGYELQIDLPGVKKEDIIAFCVYSPKEYMVSPCGACRQVMVELLPKNCKVYLAYGSKGEYIISSVDELMPLSFDKEDL